MRAWPFFAAAVRDRRSGHSAVCDRRSNMYGGIQAERGAIFLLRNAWQALVAAGLRPCVAMLLLLPGALLAADLSSEPAPLASRSLLLDVARAGGRIVAVGDRGHVLLSDDEGRNWRQVTVPTRAMLTGVSFGDARHGWAVGHDGVILATADSGVTWQRQDSGGDLETIFLDVFFSDAEHGLAVGAYGKCILTLDGGKTWQPAAPIPDDVHINQIAPTRTDAVYLAGESGTLLVSADARTPWRKCKVPYEGSLFGTLPIDEHTLLTYGLRGHVFASGDGGESWLETELTVPVLIMTGLITKNGVIVLAGTGGNFFRSRDGGRSFVNWKPNDYQGGVSSLLETSDGFLLVVGESGAARLEPPP